MSQEMITNGPGETAPAKKPTLVARVKALEAEVEWLVSIKRLEISIEEREAAKRERP